MRGRKAIQYIVYKFKEHMSSHYSFEDIELIYLCISTAMCVCVCEHVCLYTWLSWDVKCNFIWMIKTEIFCA